MSDELKPTRRELLVGTLGAAGALLLAGCDDDDGGMDIDSGPGGDTDAGPMTGMCATVGWEMGNRHPAGVRHTIDVPVAHLTAGVDQQYQIQGDSLHPHTVDVTVADFARIVAGERVVITSSFDARHDHDVTLFCSNM